MAKIAKNTKTLENDHESLESNKSLLLSHTDITDNTDSYPNIAPSGQMKQIERIPKMAKIAKNTKTLDNDHESLESNKSLL